MLDRMVVGARLVLLVVRMRSLVAVRKRVLVKSVDVSRLRLLFFLVRFLDLLMFSLLLLVAHMRLVALVVLVI